MSKPLVTIAIPTYNRADGFLREALESALQQTYEPIEILVSDNCSSDATPQVVKQLDQPNLRYVRHAKNKGPIGNFNFCLEASHGQYFLMLHDDDSIDPDFIQTCVSALDEKSATGEKAVGYVRTGVRLINEEGAVTARHPNGATDTSGKEAVLGWMRAQNYWAFPATLFNTNILHTTGGFSEEFSKTCEIHAMARIALKVGGIELEPVKASFRKHEGTISNHTSVHEWIKEWYGIYEKILGWAPSLTARDQIRETGAKFFSRMCYDLASGIESPLQRYVAYGAIYSRYGGRHLPPSLRGALHRLKRTVVRVHSTAHHAHDGDSNK